MQLRDEYDVIVVGGGPAGLSAAIRARRPRTFNFMPQSVLLITDSEPGGISNWREVYITGPSWSYRGDELRDRIMADLNRYDVPILRAEVTGLDITGSVKKVIAEGREFRAHAVILATGLKQVRNERRFMGRGLYVTIKGYLFIEKLFEEICRQNDGRNVVIIGSEAIRETLDMLERANMGRARITAVVEGNIGDGKPENIEIVDGRLVSIEGGESVEAVVVETERGPVRLPVDAVIVDFESYMRRNNTLPRVEEVMNDRGFVKVDASMKTEIPGVFAAGDITGPPFSAGRAVGQGITAGLEAHCYVHAIKFNERCPGYAFYPMFEDGEPAAFEVKMPDSDFYPLLIGDYKEVDGYFVFRECRIPVNDLNMLFLQLADGRNSMEEIVKVAEEDGETGDIKGSLTDLYRTLVLAKDMTVHTAMGGEDGGA